MITTIISAGLSAGILGLCVHRVYKSTKQTFAVVRVAFAGLGAAATWMLIATPSHYPVAVLLLQACILAVLAAATPQWKHGSPPELRHWRRSSDKS